MHATRLERLCVLRQQLIALNLEPRVLLFLGEKSRAFYVFLRVYSVFLREKSGAVSEILLNLLRCFRRAPHGGITLGGEPRALRLSGRLAFAPLLLECQPSLQVFCALPLIPFLLLDRQLRDPVLQSLLELDGELAPNAYHITLPLLIQLLQHAASTLGVDREHL